MESSTTPQRLGGDNTQIAGPDAGKMLTPDEIRRRRIEALDRSTAAATTATHDDNNNVKAPPSPAIAVAAAAASSVALESEATRVPVANIPNVILTNHDTSYFPDDEVDDELQAALALSLQDVAAEVHKSTTMNETSKSSMKSYVNDGTNEQQRPSQGSLPPDQSTFDKMHVSSSSEAATIWQEPLQNMTMYHKILWDDQLTTESDKNRWVSQGIDVRSAVNSNVMMDFDTTNSEGIEILQHEPHQPIDSSSIMDVITASHLSWGLVQHHGGPCGVLAAIQAELLRTLLYTTTSHNGENQCATMAAEMTEPHNIRKALARAIAIVLSRAAMTAACTNTSTYKSEKCENPTAVRIVLPTNDNQDLTWQDLEPWYSESDSSVPSSSLKVYCLPIPAIGDSSLPTTTATNVPLHQVESNAVTPKRQKVLIDDVCAEASTSATRHDASLHSRIDKMACLVEKFLLDENHDASSSNNSTSPAVSPLDCFRRPGGVLLLVISLIATRTIPMIMGDFDDPTDTRLTGQFGHCSQELINLLLTGQAVSNVFDNTLSPSGDMVCRGIQSRPVIGYLTQLEAMRYCEVGGYYKMPLFPIWVVGSTSHFTVLFGDLAALKESKSDMLLDECRRAFKAVEGGEENGFIQTEHLATVLKKLNIDLGSSIESDEVARIQTLSASLEVSGAGIILWDDFWKAASRLLTGATLETVLHSADKIGSISPINVDNADAPPLLLSNFAANADVQFKPEARRPTGVASGHTNYIESDEEMARRLAAEWESAGASGMMALTSAAENHLNFPTALVDTDPQPGSMGDEEYAQYLQRQYDSESAVDAALVGGESGSVAAISGSPFPVLSDTDETSSIPATPTRNILAGEDDYMDTKPAAQMTTSTESLPFEQYGDSFSLYHYNGLRGGVLTPFRITRLTAEEAVGASIALNRGTGGASTHGASGTQDLEDVLRTKWPSCVINWLGKTPPCID